MGAWIETLDCLDTAKGVLGRSLMGAWIETLYLQRMRNLNFRRSLMGAWIETTWKRLISWVACVAPLWERGLKLLKSVSQWEMKLSLPYGSVD